MFFHSINKIIIFPRYTTSSLLDIILSSDPANGAEQKQQHHQIPHHPPIPKPQPAPPTHKSPTNINSNPSPELPKDHNLNSASQISDINSQLFQFQIFYMSQLDLELQQENDSSHHHHMHDDYGSSDDGSECLSEGSCYTVFYSTAGGSYDEYRFEQDVEDGSDCSIELTEIKVCGENDEEKDCRICHLNLEELPGIAIELGCSCKDDLAVAHKSCAEQWFRIKGNKTCEICNSLACNVAGANELEVVQQLPEVNNAAAGAVAIPSTVAETRSCWQGHRFLNFLLGCMVLAFVISWVFHFRVSA